MSTRHTIVLATRNAGKIREISAVLSGLGVRIAPLEEFSKSGEISEPAEHGATFADNARDKALYYARATGQWCLADDSGLAVDALGGAPGVHSARYADDECPGKHDRAAIDRANNAKLLRALHGISDERRTARFICHLALADPERVLIEARDSVEGRIGHVEKGANGFGYDPLFYFPEKGRTTAELPDDEKNLISHRGKALRKFAAMLADLLAKQP